MAEDIRNITATKGLEAFERQFVRPHCLVLDSGYCSMGRMIGLKACNAAGYDYYDAVILLELLPEGSVTADEVRQFEERLRCRDWSKKELEADPQYQRINAAFNRAVDLALAKGPCLIHDRITKREVLAKGYSCLSAMTYAHDRQAKLVRARTSPLYQSISDDETVFRMIEEEDMIRKNWHRAHSDSPWGSRDEYDLMLNTDQLGRDYAARILAMLMQETE